MSNETLFFILGPCLVVAALVVAALGLRVERFPGSKGLLVGATVAFASLVVATAAFAWLNAEDEQEHREAELAHAAEENVAAGEEGEAAEEVGSERAIYENSDEVRSKPEQVRDNIVEGMLRKRFFAQIALRDQEWIHESGKTVGQVVSERDGEVLDFARYALAG